MGYSLSSVDKYDVKTEIENLKPIPDTRFDQHKADVKSNMFAMKNEVRLMPEIYEILNSMPFGNALYMEVDQAIRLQQLGYGVWQN